MTRRAAPSTVWKNLSTPDDPTDGILEGLERIERPPRPSAICGIGTTVATNMILERKGASVAYVATRGFRDVPFIQRGNRRSHYDITWIKPEPLVKHRHCFEVDERIDRDGDMVEALDEEGVRRARTAAERRGRDRGDRGHLPVLLPRSAARAPHRGDPRRGAAGHAGLHLLRRAAAWKEYERASTTIADAYLKPMVGVAADTHARAAERRRHPGRAVVIKSNGGEMTLEAAARRRSTWRCPAPPAASSARGSWRGCWIDRLVGLDMGGTSTDCSTIIDGAESFTTDFEIEWGIPIQVPMIDIRTIGAGGGSIAWIDKGGLLRVGPQSAGARPGPGLLRPRRHRGDGDRRQRGARPHQPHDSSSAAR